MKTIRGRLREVAPLDALMDYSAGLRDAERILLEHIKYYEKKDAKHTNCIAAYDHCDCLEFTYGINALEKVLGDE